MVLSGYSQKGSMFYLNVPVKTKGEAVRYITEST
jgi:hypothetical protein